MRLRYPQSIYGLCHPETSVIWYIGRGVNPENRFQSHLCHPVNGLLRLWVQDLKAMGLRPDLVILETVERRGEACERRWIRKMQRLNPSLLNQTDSQGRKPAGKVVSLNITEKEYSTLCERLRLSGQSLSHFLREAVQQAIASSSDKS